MLCKICDSLIPIERYKTGKSKVIYCSTKCIKTRWRLENLEKHKLSQKRYLEEHPEKRAQSSKNYVQTHKPYYTAYSSLRTRHVKVAKPKWADQKRIDWIYEEAAYFGLEVDHIIPLKHSKVCGLHVPENMQILTRSENARKGNKFNPDEDIICRIIKKVAKDD